MAKKFSGGFGGGMGGMNMNMIKQAQKMQQDMLKMQGEIEAREFTASSGGGAVSAVVTGKRELLSVAISKDVIDPDDAEMLQDLVVAAVNEALRMAESALNSEMSKMTGGLNLPF